MSLFYQHTINQTTKLGIWQIKEDENFFLSKVPLQNNITHPHKRLQHLAGRYLLQWLFNDFPYNEILIADTRKPYLQNERFHFSISHSGNYAAAIVSSTHKVGIDIEIPSIKVKCIAHKFIHQQEQKWIESFLLNSNLLISHNELLTVIWSSKETIFKWYSIGAINFKEHIQLNGLIQQQQNILSLPFSFKKENLLQMTITAQIFDRLILSWFAG